MKQTMLAPHCESCRQPGTQVKKPSSQPSHTMPAGQSVSAAQALSLGGPASKALSSTPPGSGGAPQAVTTTPIRIPTSLRMDRGR
jgi:hypothetical protein